MAKRRGHGEGSIGRSKAGRWIGRYGTDTPTGRKRIELRAATRKEVQENLIAALAERDKGVIVDDRLTVSDYLEQWLGSMRGNVKDVTLERYRHNVEHHILPRLGSTKLSKLRPHNIQVLYDEKARTMSPASVRLIHGVLSGALKQAVMLQLINQNPADHTNRPKQTATEIKPLTADEARALLRAAEGDPLEAVYVLALTTGARIGELLALRWSDLDFDAGILRIERTRSAATTGPRFTTPKGGRSRSIHLTPRSLEALRSHRARQNEMRLAAVVWEDADLIFTTRSGSVIRPSTLTDDHFKPLLERAGLPRSTRFHDLRHSCATLLLSRGVDVVSVQRLLGHASPSMTLNVYGHLLPGMGEATAAAMESALS
jgi:integrase